MNFEQFKAQVIDEMRDRFHKGWLGSIDGKRKG